MVVAAESSSRVVVATVLATAIVAAIVAWHLAISIGWWGVSHDAANHFYVAWLASRGAMVYRDVLEVNWPGTFLTFRALASVGADGDLAWRMVDLALVAAAAGLVAALSWSAGRLPAAVAATLVAWAHLMAGSIDLAQRDHFVGVLVLAALLALRNGLAGAGVAGLLLGYAAIIKPFVLVMPVAVLYLAAGPPVRRVIAAALVGATMAAILGVTAWHLHAKGALAPFLDQQLYAMRVYTDTGRRPFLEAALDIAIIRAPMLALAVAGLFAARRDNAWRSAVAMLLYGTLHFAIQGKGLGYHALPLLYGLALLAALGTERLLAARRALARLAPVALLTLAAIATMATMPAAVRSANPSQAPAMMRDLAARLRPGDRIQPFDTYGTIDAMRRLGVQPATRFLYDFVFFARPSAPLAIAAERQLRTQFLAELTAAAPRAIVVTNQQWPDRGRGYERFETWPELEEFLASRYALEVERETLHGWAYRIYWRRDP